MKSFWDKDGNGSIDFSEILMGLFMIVVYVSSAAFMLSTFTRSYHLLSSPAFMPDIEGWGWWAFLTAICPEVGLLLAWLSGETGMRKGRWQFVAYSVIGFIVFLAVVSTMQLYDVALIEGNDLSGARDAGHFIASLLPLFTIAYAAIGGMLISAMSGQERANRNSGNSGGKKVVDNNWTLNQPQPRQRQPEYSLPKSPRPNTFEQEESIFKTYGEPVSDPVLDIRKANHKAATELAESNRSNNRHDPK